MPSLLKKWFGLCAALLWAIPAQATIDHRIAQGLPPLAKNQSIQSLQLVQGQFRILSTKKYSSDEQAKFSPIDYAVSWGLFAQPKIANQIVVQQYNRYLNWSLATLPVPVEQAMQMVSNMHMVPANPAIAEQLTQVKRGDLVYLQGDLVEIKDEDLVWRSSLSTTDVGEGACEVFRVSALTWIEHGPKDKKLS